MADGFHGKPVLIEKSWPFPKSIKTAIARDPLLQASFFSPEDFRRDMKQMITGVHAGDGLKYVLTNPESFRLYASFNKASLAGNGEDYYLFPREVELIHANIDYFRELGRSFGGPQAVMIELGTGTELAVRKKTIPLARAINPSHYVGIDYSIQSAFTSASMVGTKLPRVKPLWFHHDFNQVPFNRDHDDREWDRPIIAMELGGTLGNVAGRPGEGLPRAHVMAAMRNYRASMKEGDYLILGIDQNQDEESLHKCYGMASIERFGRGLLRHIHSDVIHQYGFVPDDFEYKREWHPESHLYTHKFVAKKPMIFTLEGAFIHFEKGEGFAYCNSYKYPQEFLDEVFAASAFKPVRRFADNDNRMNLHVLQAVPVLG